MIDEKQRFDNFRSNTKNQSGSEGVSNAYHISDNPAYYEPSRNNAFQFIVVDPSFPVNDILLAGADAESTDPNDYLNVYGSYQEVLKLSISEAFVPHFDLDVIEIKRGNSSVKFAGTPSFSEGTLKFNDYVGARTKDILMAWHAMAYDVKTDVVQLAGNYKYDCMLIEYSPDFSRILRKWRLVNCWIKSFSEGNFSHESNDKRSVDVTIVYDRAIPDYSDTVISN